MNRFRRAWRAFRAELRPGGKPEVQPPAQDDPVDHVDPDDDDEACQLHRCPGCRSEVQVDAQVKLPREQVRRVEREWLERGIIQ